MRVWSAPYNSPSTLRQTLNPTIEQCSASKVGTEPWNPRMGGEYYILRRHGHDDNDGEDDDDNYEDDGDNANDCETDCAVKEKMTVR